MKTKLIENKKNYKLAMKMLGVTNLFKTIYIFTKWIIDPQKAVDIANKLLLDIKHNKKEVLPKVMAIGYINEFYSKYLVWGRSNEYAISINKQVDQGKLSNNKLIAALIELRKIRLYTKKIS